MHPFDHDRIHTDGDSSSEGRRASPSCEDVDGDEGGGAPFISDDAAAGMEGDDEGLLQNPALNRGPTRRERWMMPNEYPVRDRNFPEPSSDESDDDHGSWANRGSDVPEDLSEDIPLDADGASGEPVTKRWEILSDVGDGGDGGGGRASEPGNNPPRLEDLHRGVYTAEEASLMEGGAAHLRYNSKAANSVYYPFRTMSQLMFMKFVTDHQLPRTVVSGLLAMMRFEGPEPGEIFSIGDLEGVQAEHFVARTRECMPLFEVYKRKVRCSPTTIAAAGPESTSDVYDVPVNLILARDLQSRTSMKTFMDNPGGKRLSRDEAISSNLRSEHLFSGPEKRPGTKRRGNMNGKCARNTPHHGFDGVKGLDGRTVYVHDLAIVDIGNGDIKPCRILELFWDADKNVLAATVRRLRSVEEIYKNDGVTYLQPGGSNGRKFLRLWEQQGANSEFDVKAIAIKDLLEIYTMGDAANQHHTEGWIEGSRSLLQPHACVGEGFVVEKTKGSRRRGGNKRNAPGGDSSKNALVYKPSSFPWMVEGTQDEPLFSIRKEGFFHNLGSKPFLSAPYVVFTDGFNAHGMGNKKSIGGTYVGWAWNSQTVQRRRDEIHITTLASPGASSEGEMDLLCRVAGALQKGCLASVQVQLPGGEWQLVEVRVHLCVSPGCRS